jgi:hypothetical protein
MAADARRSSAEILVASPVWRFAAARGLVALHAAAVSGPAGTVIIRGRAGSGKSTSAHRAALAGWAVIADEVVWYDPLVKPPVIRGSGAPLTLDDATLDPGTGPDTPFSYHGTASGKSSVLGARYASSAPLGPVAILVERASGAAGWRRLGDVEARAAFQSGRIPGELTQDPDRLADATEALLAMGAYELRAGAPGAVPRQLEEIALDALEGGSGGSKQTDHLAGGSAGTTSATATETSE